jgi:hypothetical protein
MLPKDLIPEGSVLYTVRKEQFKFKRKEFIKWYVVIINMVYMYNLKICFARWVDDLNSIQFYRFFHSIQLNIP